MSVASDPPSGVRGGPARDRTGTRLDGWKAIAGHLGRDIRTVQRWELSEGLPVHRLGHRQRSSAYAYSGELDAWVAARAPAERDGEGDPDAAMPAPGLAAPPQPARRRRLTAVTATGLLLVSLGLLGAGVVTWRVLRGGSAAQADTRHPQAYSAFAEGQALYLSRHYHEAAISLERAVTLDPSYGIAWAWLGKAYGRLAQPVWAGGPPATDRATEAAQRAVTHAPDTADSHVALALAARARGDVEGWRSSARRALELDARTAEALALLGDSYGAVIYSCRLDQDAALAEEYYRQAMELMPSLTTAASNRAGNLRRMGRNADCIDLLNRTMRDYPDSTPLLAVRGVCRLLQGDVEGATEDIAPLRSNPKIAPAGSLVYLGLLALKTGRTEDGVRDLEAFTQYDRSARAELIVAEAYAVAGHIDRAAAHITRAIALDPACAPFVAKSIAFSAIRGEKPIESVLARHGIH